MFVDINERNEKICREYQDGKGIETLKSLGVKYGITQQRVFQIVRRGRGLPPIQVLKYTRGILNPHRNRKKQTTPVTSPPYNQ